jgi:hypothetical protein
MALILLLIGLSGIQAFSHKLAAYISGFHSVMAELIYLAQPAWLARLAFFSHIGANGLGQGH